MNQETFRNILQTCLFVFLPPPFFSFFLFIRPQQTALNHVVMLSFSFYVLLCVLPSKVNTGLIVHQPPSRKTSEDKKKNRYAAYDRKKKAAQSRVASFLSCGIPLCFVSTDPHLMVSFTQQRHTYDFYRHRIYIIVPHIKRVVEQLRADNQHSDASSVRNWIGTIDTAVECGPRKEFLQSIRHYEPAIEQLLHYAVQALEQLCGLCTLVECSSTHLNALWHFVCRQLYELPTRLHQWSFQDIRQAIDRFLAEQTQLSPDQSICPPTQSATRYRLECLQTKVCSWATMLYVALANTRTREQFESFIAGHLIENMIRVIRDLSDTFITLLGQPFRGTSITTSATDVCTHFTARLYHFLLTVVVPFCPGLSDAQVDATQEIQTMYQALKSFVPQMISVEFEVHDSLSRDSV